jgi:hypothetical protein
MHEGDGGGNQDTIDCSLITYYSIDNEMIKTHNLGSKQRQIYPLYR